MGEAEPLPGLYRPRGLVRLDWLTGHYLFFKSIFGACSGTVSRGRGCKRNTAVRPKTRFPLAWKARAWQVSKGRVRELDLALHEPDRVVAGNRLQAVPRRGDLQLPIGRDHEE